MDDWRALVPGFEWRPSQRHLLDLAGHVADERWHLCAPPGAGKTLIGLELARRVARPTLVLAPTTAIREQWRDATAMFGADPDTFTTADLDTPAPLLAVTYQLLGNPGEAAGELQRAARRLWVAEVAAEVGPAQAEDRVAAVEEGDRRRARREVARHVRALRRSLSTGADVGVPREALLGERAARRVEHLAGLGIGCVVLDECHHLLDWWALVVAALVERVATTSDVAVIGLTATLPDPDSSREAENYRGLLGDVDAELHLAAMVAEGAVAPWRDGVRVTALTGEEATFLDHWTDRLAAELDEHLSSEAFVGWAVAQVTTAALDARALLHRPGAERPAPPRPAATDAPRSDPAGWDAFWDRDPLAAAGLARWWAARQMALPAGFRPPPGAEGDLTLGDRLTLVDAWLHDPAAVLPESVREDVRDRASRYAVSFTTAGIRWGRSVADLVCARSSAKGPAAADILAAEASRRGDRLRALVVVERDRATSPPAAARRVLGEDAGTAARVLSALCARADVARLGVLAVTGRGAWAGAIEAEAICAAINVALGDSGRWATVEGCDISGAVGLAGHGPGWEPSRWLAAAEAAMDGGAARVLVATRGLVGEGWDHPPLNVMVDLSEVASSTATTQLRGRALRLDPAHADKLVSLWDVVVAHPAAPGDWARLRRRHAHWWGPDGDGSIVTGAEKLHRRAGRPQVPASVEEREEVNADSARAVADEEATRRAWAGVDPGGTATTVVHVRPRRRRRVRTRPRHWRWLSTVAAVTGTSSALAGVVAPATTPALWPVAAAGGVAAVVLTAAARGRQRSEREVVEALAEAVLSGLLHAGDDGLTGARTEVQPDPVDPAGAVIATVAGCDDDAAARWADAVAETLGPLGSPRWMVVVGDQVWRVPSALGATRRNADAFTRGLRSRVPGVELVQAGTPRATAFVLAAARQRPDEVGRSLLWR